MLSVKIF